MAKHGVLFSFGLPGVFEGNCSVKYWSTNLRLNMIGAEIPQAFKLNFVAGMQCHEARFGNCIVDHNLGMGVHLVEKINILVGFRIFNLEESVE